MSQIPAAQLAVLRQQVSTEASNADVLCARMLDEPSCQQIESALKVLMRKGRIPQKKIVTLAMGGDGGTADIGLQALSGALERGHDFLYVCTAARPAGSRHTLLSSAIDAIGHTFLVELNRITKGLDGRIVANGSQNNAQNALRQLDALLRQPARQQ